MCAHASVRKKLLITEKSFDIRRFGIWQKTFCGVNNDTIKLRVMFRALNLMSQVVDPYQTASAHTQKEYYILVLYIYVYIL